MRAGLAHSLMVEAVDKERLGPSHNLAQQGTLCRAHGVGSHGAVECLGVLEQGGRGAGLSGVVGGIAQVLPDAAVEGGHEHLNTPADAENG